MLRPAEGWYQIDLSWQQFPAGSIVQELAVIKRQELNDSEATRLRCALPLKRVDDYLKVSPQSLSAGCGTGCIISMSLLGKFFGKKWIIQLRRNLWMPTNA